MNNKINFPSKENRPRHEYHFDNCAGCQKPIADDEAFTEVVMTDIDGMRKNHIALCSKCDKSARKHGAY